MKIIAWITAPFLLLALKYMDTIGADDLEEIVIAWIIGLAMGILQIFYWVIPVYLLVTR